MAPARSGRTFLEGSHPSADHPGGRDNACVGMAKHELGIVGLATMGQNLARNFASRGVRVNAIGPGAVYTALSRDRLDDPKVLGATLAHIPMGRVAQPEDLKGAAVFLASDESAYVTGITLFVDGGWLTV